MMLNVIRSDITIKNLTWYQRHPERSLCTAETSATATAIED